MAFASEQNIIGKKIDKPLTSQRTEFSPPRALAMKEAAE